MVFGHRIFLKIWLSYFSKQPDFFFFLFLDEKKQSFGYAQDQGLRKKKLKIYRQG
jgi:hypothetical protein